MNLATRQQSGFTLLEMLVVVAILGILAAVAVPSLTGLTSHAGTSVVNDKALYTIYVVEGNTQREIGSFNFGDLLIRSPKKMSFGESGNVSLSLMPSKPSTSSINTSTESSNKGTYQTISDKVELYSVMTAELKAANFKISDNVAINRIVSFESMTDWTWVIAPDIIGNQSLIIELSAPVRVQGFEGLATKAVYRRLFNIVVEEPFDFVNYLRNPTNIFALLGWVLSTFFGFRLIAKERNNLLPYINEWSTFQTINGVLIIKVKMFVQNRSSCDNTVERILLKARGVRNFNFEPSKVDIYTDPNSLEQKARIIYQGNKEEICLEKDLLSLPLTIAAHTTKGGWIAFVIEPEYVAQAKISRWCIRVTDQACKNYISDKRLDQKIK